METMLTTEEWPAMLAGLHSGNVVQVDPDVFDYFLGVLPPVNMGKDIDIPGFGEPTHTSFGFAEGPERIIYFWQRKRSDGEYRYFAWQSEEVNA